MERHGSNKNGKALKQNTARLGQKKSRNQIRMSCEHFSWWCPHCSVLWFCGCCSVAKLCSTLCNFMDCSMPGFPVFHYLSEFVMSIELMMPPNHLILCRSLLILPSIYPSIRVFSNESVLCFRWPSIETSALASVFPMNIQDWLPLGWTGWISLLSKGLSRVFYNTTVQKHHFFGAQLMYNTILISGIWHNDFTFKYMTKWSLW